jgi:hypothetical protein
MACHVSYCIRRRAYLTEETATAMITAAAHIPRSEATTPASPRNVRSTGAASSLA